MSRVTGKPPVTGTHWRRPITRTYDYNMNLGENYYKPQLDYINSRKGRGKTPPSATTFAERLLKFPPSRRAASATRRDELGLGETAGASSYSSSAAADAAGRYASLDDLGFDEDFIRRRRNLLEASQENLAHRGASPSMGSSKGLHVTFGDKMLDAIGVKESSASSKMTSGITSEEGDAIDKILAERRSRRQQGNMLAIKSADADMFTEDPFKTTNVSSRLQQARREMDEMRDELRSKDAETNSASSRFRKRLQAKRDREMREEQLDNQFFGGSLSSLNESGSMSPQISAVSKARQFLADSSAESGSRSAGVTSGRSVSMQQLKISSSSSASKSAASAAKNTYFDDDDSETAALLSKVEQIRNRAKARIAQITDEDFPDLQIGSSLASRRAAGRQQLNFDDDFESSGSSSGRAITMSKRTLKSSYDIE